MAYLINTRKLDGLENVHVTRVEDTHNVTQSFQYTPYGITMNGKLLIGRVQLVSDVGGVLIDHVGDVGATSILDINKYKYIDEEIKNMFITSDGDLVLLTNPDPLKANINTVYTLPIAQLDKVYNFERSDAISILRSSHHEYGRMRWDITTHMWGEASSFVNFLSGDVDDQWKSVHVVSSEVTLAGIFILPSAEKVKRQKLIRTKPRSPYMDPDKKHITVEDLSNGEFHTVEYNEGKVCVIARNLIHLREHQALVIVPFEHILHTGGAVSSKYEIIGLLIDDA